MRVALGGVWHETNTFAAHPTARADFEVHEGEALRESFKGTRTPLGGFIDGAFEHRLDVAPILFASATPSGTVQRPAYEELATRLIAGLAEARPDAVLLDLHGAMVVDGIDEVEGDLVRRIRKRLGKIPIGAVLDFHANINPSFVDAIDVFAGYDTYPHVDPYDRALEVSGLVARMLSARINPARVLVHPPLLTVPQAQMTDQSPMRELMQAAHDAERTPGVLSVTVAGGFAYADVPHAGLSVVATTDGHPTLAGEVATAIARQAWNAREKFRVSNLAPDAAVQQAMREPRGPVILVDVADNIGGGSPGDGTVLLEALLRAGAKDAVVTMSDPALVAQARAAGEGAGIKVRVGGKTDPLHGAPVEVEVRVERLGSGDFTYKGSYMTNRRVTAGQAAVLRAGGVRILARERKVMPFDREEIEVMGIDPRACRILVVKSALAWRAAYGDLATAVIDVDTPGICTARLDSLPYRRVQRPLVPLDPKAEWP